MKLEVDIAGQNLLFLQAMLLGVAISVFYDVFRLLRIAIRFKTVVVFIQDMIFWISCAVAVFLFMLIFNGGVIRGYLILACFLGALIYHLTLGALLMKTARFIIDKIKRLFKFIYKRILVPIFMFFFKPISKACKFIAAKIKLLKIKAKEKSIQSKKEREKKAIEHKKIVKKKLEIKDAKRREKYKKKYANKMKKQLESDTPVDV